jgi:hypothetical protein
VNFFKPSIDHDVMRQSSMVRPCSPFRGFIKQMATTVLHVLGPICVRRGLSISMGSPRVSVGKMPGDL